MSLNRRELIKGIIGFTGSTLLSSCKEDSLNPEQQEIYRLLEPYGKVTLARPKNQQSIIRAYSNVGIQVPIYDAPYPGANIIKYLPSNTQISSDMSVSIVLTAHNYQNRNAVHFVIEAHRVEGNRYVIKYSNAIKQPWSERIAGDFTVIESTFSQDQRQEPVVNGQTHVRPPAIQSIEQPKSPQSEVQAPPPPSQTQETQQAFPADQEPERNVTLEDIATQVAPFVESKGYSIMTQIPNKGELKRGKLITDPIPESESSGNVHRQAIGYIYLSPHSGGKIIVIGVTTKVEIGLNPEQIDMLARSSWTYAFIAYE